MKVLLLSHDTKLKQLLERHDFFTTVEQHHTVKQESADVMIISDQLMNEREFEAFLQGHEEGYLFYMMGSHHSPKTVKRLNALAAAKDMVIVPPRLDTVQVHDRIISAFEQDYTTPENVFTFFSVLSNVGTTTTAFSTAEALSEENGDLKIAFLSLNAWDDGTDYMDYYAKYLDQLKPLLNSDALSQDETFMDAFFEYKKDKLYVLAGNSSIKMERHYQPAEIKTLIDTAKSVFDVVIIDAGCHFDNALMVQALECSEYQFFVTNQQPKALKKYNQLKAEILNVLGYQEEDFLLVVNNVLNQANYPTSKDLTKKYDMSMITEIRHMKQGMAAEINSQSLYSFHDLNYNESIMPMVRIIAQSLNVSLKENEQRRKGLFGMKKGVQAS